MSHTNSQINFGIGVTDNGAKQEFQALGRELDKLEAKKEKLGKDGKKKEISDRQFNKALKQDSIGDAFEALGLGTQALEVSKLVGAAGLAAKGFQIVGEQAGIVADKIRDIRDGQEHLTDAMGDFARQIPILGWAVKGFDGIREAITGEGREIEQLKKQAEEASKAFDKLNTERRKLMEGVAGGANKAFQELAIAGAPDQTLAKAQAELNAERANIQKQRDEAKRLGLNSGEVKAGLDMQEAAAREKYNQAWREAYNKQLTDQIAAAEKAKQQQMEIAKSAADAEFEYRQKTLRAGGLDLQADVEAAKRKAEQAASGAKSDRERRAILAGGAVDQEQLRNEAMRSVAERIKGLQGDEAEKMQGISQQTRHGALASGGSIGTANQLASQQRASSDPVAREMQAQQKTSQEQLKVLQDVLAELRKGNMPAIPVFN